MTARLLLGRGSSESGRQRYEEQPCGWEVSHSPALPSLEEGQENPEPWVTPERQCESGSPGPAWGHTPISTRQKERAKEAPGEEGGQQLRSRQGWNRWDAFQPNMVIPGLQARALLHPAESLQVAGQGSWQALYSALGLCPVTAT